MPTAVLTLKVMLQASNYTDVKDRVDVATLKAKKDDYEKKSKMTASLVSGDQLAGDLLAVGQPATAVDVVDYDDDMTVVSSNAKLLETSLLWWAGISPKSRRRLGRGIAVGGQRQR